MNIDTGKLYYTAEEIAAAKARGERLVEVPPEFTDSRDLKTGYPAGNRKERRRQAAMTRRLTAPATLTPEKP